jgi:hypothetical protein
MPPAIAACAKALPRRAVDGAAAPGQGVVAFVETARGKF